MTNLIISLLIITLCATFTIQQTDLDGHAGLFGIFRYYVFFQRWHGGTSFSDACGGSLIAPTWILTTANCGSPANNTIYRVLFGTVNWEDETNAEQIMETTLFYRHPLFNDHSGNRTFNVGLMELPREITITQNVEPINLPWDLTDYTFAGEEYFLVAILNQVENHVFNHNTRYSRVKILSDSDCDILKPNYRNDYEMCTTITERNPHHSPCGANPGTALANYINGTWTLVGSGADQSCSLVSVVPARWNRITDYLPWITEITGLTKNAN